MRLIELTRKTLALALAAQLFTMAPFVPEARAGMVGTDTAIARHAPPLERATLLADLKTPEVRDQLVALGVDPEEAHARIAALTDDEIAALAAEIEAGTAGGASIVGALLTVFVVLLVTDILCLTRVFNFTRCAR